MPTCKKVVFVCRFFVWRFCFFFVFLFFVRKKTPKGFFSCNFGVFFLFCVPKRPVFKILLFFLFCFLSWLSFVFPFKTPFLFFAFCPSTSFWKTLIFLVSLSFFFLPSPFLMFACFFQTNFPNIPFLKPKLLSFLVVYLFHLLFFVLFSCFMFLPFCFDVGFVFGIF